MKVMMLVDRKKLELTDMEMPAVGADDLLVRVRACGICGSDVHGYDLSTGRRIPPIVMGHEAAGMVEAVGANVKGFKPGDRVTFDSMVSCTTCAFCRAGEINLCDNRRVLGVSCGEYRRHGCFAEYVTVPQHITYRLPDALPFEHAAMVEAVSIAVHAVNRAGKILGRSCVVVGAGMIGQLTIQVLRAGGCGVIIATDLDAGRLERARKSGADHVFRADDAELLARVQGLTGGRGADLVFEAVGSNAPVAAAIACARKGGSVVLIGNTSPKVELPLQAVVTRELTLLGTCGSQGEYPACLEMMVRGQVKVAELISAAVPLAEGPSWFERLYNHEPGLMKVIIKP
jgi:L-iditol 2-dehydrogenase